VTNSHHTLRPSSIIYNESALTLEKLSILKAWAEVYVASMKNETAVKTDFFRFVFFLQQTLDLKRPIE
jgi:hypothetical protein